MNWPHSIDNIILVQIFVTPNNFFCIHPFYLIVPFYICFSFEIHAFFYHIASILSRIASIVTLNSHSQSHLKCYSKKIYQSAAP